MHRKISQVNPVEINKKIGSHTYEIIEFSTEWCGHCEEMNKALEKILEEEPFKNIDLHIYAADGDFFSESYFAVLLIKDIIQKHSFPMKITTFEKAMKKELLNSFYLSQSQLTIRISRIKQLLQLQEQGTLIEMTEYSTDLLESENIMEKFKIQAYPTLIFFKNGKPIQTPLEENDWQSRGFEIYSEDTHKDIKNAIILTVPLKQGTPPTKIIQINPILDARIEGFSSEEELRKQLLKFIAM